VVESLVVKADEGLTALIFPDYDLLSRELKLFGRPDRETETRLDTLFRTVLADVNAQLPAFSRLASFRLMEQEFVKTPTEKIKRHMYQ
jgi:long-chain acyl-CoA synthetase